VSSSRPRCGCSSRRTSTASARRRPIAVAAVMSRDGQERLWAYRNALVGFPSASRTSSATPWTSPTASRWRACSRERGAASRGVRGSRGRRHPEGRRTHHLGLEPHAERILGPPSPSSVRGLRADGTPFPRRRSRTRWPCARASRVHGHMGVVRPTGILCGSPWARGRYGAPVRSCRSVWVLSFSEIRQAPRAVPRGARRLLHGILPSAPRARRSVTAGRVVAGGGVTCATTPRRPSATALRGLRPAGRQRFDLIE